MQPKLLAQTEWGTKIAAYLFLAGVRYEVGARFSKAHWGVGPGQ